jgi:hypothetical protein
MKEAQKNVRKYLAAIGRRGGLASRRELTRSHAKQFLSSLQLLLDHKPLMMHGFRHAV